MKILALIYFMILTNSINTNLINTYFFEQDKLVYTAQMHQIRLYQPKDPEEKTAYKHDHIKQIKY